MDAANKNLMNELEYLAPRLKQNEAEGNEKSHVLKIDQQQDGYTNFAVYAGDSFSHELSGNYKMDYSDTRYKLSCANDHCKSTFKYGMIEEGAPNNKIGIEEKYDSNSDHFNVNLAFYDENDNCIGKYGVELSPQFEQGPECFVIHDLIHL